MSISHLPEVENQMNQYFESQNTMALADSTKALYNSVIRKKLLPFCKEQEIDNLNERFTDHMDGKKKYPQGNFLGDYFYI